MPERPGQRSTHVSLRWPAFSRRFGRWLVAIAVLIATEPACASFLDSDSRSVGGLTIQLVIVPASFALEHTPEHTGRGLHGGPTLTRYTHHLIVAVFEARGDARIVDAKVTAVVSSNLGMLKHVALEPMAFGDAPVKAAFWHRHRQP